LHESQILLPIDSFATLCQQNQLPAYCFIEPRYTPQTDGDGYYAPNDQHPDYDVALGEGLIKHVYDALRSNDEVWMSSLLLIVYDEHGGLYDHVRPPRAIPPDAVPCDTPRFDFSRLGVRVPAILVSPYIQAGRIVSDVFDHTSILATAMSLFDPSSWPSSVFGQRARVARRFHTYLRLNQPPRMDNPFASLHDVRAAPQATSIAPQHSSVAPRPLSELQRALVRQAAILEGRMIRTDREAGDYLSRVMANIRRWKQ
jgi:phospholipase C